MTKVSPPPKRIQQNLLAASEKRLLAWICPRLPAWVTPDGLTGLAILATLCIGFGYAMSTFAVGWLALSIGGYVVHWFGDSLDGSIARFRRIERPRYGYLVDHSADVFGALVMFVGIGFSPYVEAEVALLTTAAYFMLMAHTFIMAKVAGEFPMSHLGAGPTELRLILIALTIAMWIVGPDARWFAGLGPFDYIFGAAAIVMVAVFMIQTIAAARRMAALDAAARRDQEMR
ncbi:CDP-alcohol phosphatidyltransferase family protein [Tsuneonella amylolytica]|uniref:CDP-alcohol phosphatidyltransferase family protein n=1 Tax=Tsuneonella amylolytica TaxID=2338327 RepID=UPI000EA86C77|nr:CDP-alcohol phosphatidyltransferase family protein [Tsuneonella amylolytica]